MFCRSKFTVDCSGRNSAWKHGNRTLIMHTNSINKQPFIFLMQSMFAMFSIIFCTLNVCFCNFISVSSYYMKQYKLKCATDPLMLWCDSRFCTLSLSWILHPKQSLSSRFCSTDALRGEIAKYHKFTFYQRNAPFALQK